MRRYVIFLPPVVALALFIACDDSGSNGGDGGTFNFDGGNFEASTPLPPPPPPNDSGLDANDSGPLPVTVVVTSHGKPVAGIPVVAHAASGAVTGTTTTAADGRASFLGVQPSMVSALLGNPAFTFGGHEIVTWVGVQSG